MQSSPFAVIFDMDGVLVDSEPLTIRAYVQAAAEFGVRLDEEEFVRLFVIEGTMIRPYFESLGGRVADWQAFFGRKTEIYRAMVRDGLRIMPGVLVLLDDLKRNGVPRALATSAARASMDLVFAACDFADSFQATVTLEDVTKPKPHPEPFLKAAALLQMPPSRCVVIEDALKGITAAKAAGMKCVAVPTPLSRPEHVAAADLVVGSLEEVSAARLGEVVRGSG